MKFARFISVLILLTAASLVQAQTTVERWGRFEASFRANVKGNPFDVQLTAVFSGPGKVVVVHGFYDGDGVFKVRFMPQVEGSWTYVTRCNVPALNRKTGTFKCIPPSPDNHGIVRVDPQDHHSFLYADGKVFRPLGTTAYSWAHQPESRQIQTIHSLKAARFNKVRMCVFPKYYPLVHEEPELLPFEKRGSSFDFSRPNPAFYRHLEALVDSLDAIGVQADLILFHPYDNGHWGFDNLSLDVDLKYIDYIEARMSSMRNVWWSLANEFDYCKSKSADDWSQLITRVNADDPYSHLCSIHGSTAKYYPYWKAGLTHTSIQDEAPVEDFGRAAIVRGVYDMPVIFDEVCYEGHLASRWGRLSGQEMLNRIWQGLIAGTYVTHGEAYQFSPGDFDDIFWAKGGVWRGESWKRIGFTQDILSRINRSLELADVSRDHRTATDGDGNYYVYFGTELQDAWEFSLPAKCASYPKPQPGAKYKVDIIDVWNMTTTTCADTFVLGSVEDYRMYDTQHRRIRLPLTPYLLLRITKE